MKISETLISKYEKELQNCRFIIVQHLLNDTKEFIISLIKAKLEIVRVLAKPYSFDENVYQYLTSENIRLFKLTGNENYDESICVSTLQGALNLSIIDKKKIVILDLGGEFANYLSTFNVPQDIEIIVVEDTAFGHRKYEKLKTFFKNIRIFSVAQSQFKEIEAKFVGATIATSTENIFRTLGLTLGGEKTLVVGYGLIGKNLALTLKKMNCKVSVFDISPIKLCHAHYDGFYVAELKKLLSDNNVIFGVTGTTSVSLDNIKNCKNNTFLVSGSSKQIEFEIVNLKQNINFKVEKTSKDIEVYKFKNKNIYVLNKGFPVNFLTNSIPDSVIDFMFAEMIECILAALNQEYKLKIINTINQLRIDEIANIFLMRKNT